MDNPFHIKHFLNEFNHICDVVYDHVSGYWSYINQNNVVMFSSHRSWVYFIVVNGIIVKVGETGNPLAIEKYNKVYECKKGTMSRLGRYINGDNTDEYVRENLADEKDIKIYARMCDVVRKRISVGGDCILVETTMHKDLEMAYLDHFQRVAGSYPRLNKARK